MVENLKGDLGLMKEMNRGLILDVIHKLGPISRAEVAERTALNPSTVTRIVADLMDEGYVAEVGYAESKGGRRPILIDLIPSAAYVVGVSVEAASITGIVTNLAGQIVLREWEPIIFTSPEMVSKEVILALIKKVIDQLLAQGKEYNYHVIGIGVAMHGLVDAVKGISLFPPAFGWKNLSVVNLLEASYDLPVKLENNARAMALGESWFGRGLGLNNFICLKVGRGIGSGMFFNGEIFRGIDQSAGEIGHTTVMLDGPQCDCGNYGCLESLASVKAMIRRAQRALKEGMRSKIFEYAEGHVEAIEPQHIYQAAREGDSLALQILEDVGRYLGIAIANLTNLLNPTKVLLGGEIYDGLEFIIPTIRQMVDTRAMELPAKRVQIEPVKLGADAVSIGAVTLILRQIFRP